VTIRFDCSGIRSRWNNVWSCVHCVEWNC